MRKSSCASFVAAFIGLLCCNVAAAQTSNSIWADDSGEFTIFAGVDGAKQPQDFGVNANLGGRAAFNWSSPLAKEWGLGFQFGSAIVGSGNAVQVYELLGEDTGRVQSYTTLGLFQRTDDGWFWGGGYDLLYQESYDDFTLGQWRFRAGKKLNQSTEVGTTLNLPGHRDSGFFNATLVTLDPITQATVYCRHRWQTGVQTTFWIGIAEGHGESNAVTGTSPDKGELFVFGADLHAPLNDYLALYGEANLMMPADTGTVDAFLGIEIFPWGGSWLARQRKYSALLPVAGSPSFSVDLSP